MRGDLLYVWQAREAEGWYTIAAGEGSGGQAVALVSRSRDAAENGLRPLAVAYGQHQGVSVRLAQLKVHVILEVIKP